ncbi:hypothetical protein, partial [Vibrio anguillarum]|uniref:hypothetical protein n=1 Tax=Vibrio anguillarum TaxID=55601 RepID=UPI001BE42A2F
RGSARWRFDAPLSLGDQNGQSSGSEIRLSLRSLYLQQPIDSSLQPLTVERRLNASASVGVTQIRYCSSTLKRQPPRCACQKIQPPRRPKALLVTGQY